MTVGERLKALRLQTGLSQVEFAEKIDVSKQTLYKYENNIITNIPSDKIEAAAKLGNVSPAYLMGWEDSSVFKSVNNFDLIIETQNEADLLISYRSLDDINKQKSSSYIRNLLYNQKLENELTAAHERTDVPHTKEGLQHDLDIMNDDANW